MFPYEALPLPPYAVLFAGQTDAIPGWSALGPHSPVWAVMQNVNLGRYAVLCYARPCLASVLNYLASLCLFDIHVELEGVVLVSPPSSVWPIHALGWPY